jgi:hypothetical protein
MTLLDTLLTQLRHAARFSPGEVPPVCVLWCDPERQFTAALRTLRERLPELLCFGEWDAEIRTGPAFWIRLAVDRLRPDEAPIPESATPVVYVPGVARGDLRAGEDCPDELKPLVDLLHRGAAWTQINGRDWTLEALLVNKEAGLQLDLAKDERTRRAALGSLAVLLNTPVGQLRGKRLEAEDFDKLMVADTPRELLSWLGDPSIRVAWEDERWKAFCSRCQSDYGWHPEKDGALEGGARLGARAGAWKALWGRFCEAPSSYPGLPDLLRRAQPQELLLDPEPWPAENEKAEGKLREALLSLGTKSALDARFSIKQLEAEHANRRDWPWVRLGLSPLAEALKPLARLATLTNEPLTAETLDTLALRHAADGWQADEAALLALASPLSITDAKAVETAVASLYRPWLEAAAVHFQTLAASATLPPTQPVCTAEIGECLLFVDGLRLDLGRALEGSAIDVGLHVTLSTRWAALPTVTATAKPYVMPVAEQVCGGKLGETLEPMVTATAQPARTSTLRKLAEQAGYQVLLDDDLGDPAKPEARGWVEFGQIDHHGHAHGARLARHLADEVRTVLERIQGLLAAGWKTVRVLTDHGWLLMPGGLPKVDIPKFLTATRWSRCAVLKANAQPGTPVAPWTWNPQEEFAFPPGIACFSEGQDYAHGGLSLQECLLPVLTLASSDAGNAIVASIAKVTWRGLRCQVEVSPPDASSLLVDLREKTGDPSSSLLEDRKPRSFKAGRASLLVPDESLEGESATLVLLDASGTVIAKRATIIGGD